MPQYAQIFNNVKVGTCQFTLTASIERKKGGGKSTYVGGGGPSYANVDMPCRCLCLGLDVHIT
jgi:hypothetical protein